MNIAISSLSAAGNGDISVNIEIKNDEASCRQSFIISSDAYVKMALCKGEISSDIYDAIEQESKIYAALKRGIAILGFCACSEKNLITKLLAKGFQKEYAIPAVKRLKKLGYINDASSARREAERCIAKLWGERRIRACLSQKGYEGEVINEVLFSLEDEGIDLGENCVKLIENKYPILPKDRTEMQKLIAAISRYGYDISQIKNAIAKIRSN